MIKTLSCSGDFQALNMLDLQQYPAVQTVNRLAQKAGLISAKIGFSVKINLMRWEDGHEKSRGND